MRVEVSIPDKLYGEVQHTALATGVSIERFLAESDVDNSPEGEAAESSLAGIAFDAANAGVGEIEGEFMAEDIDNFPS